MGEHMGTALVGAFYVAKAIENALFNITQTYVVTGQARKSIPTIGFAKDFFTYLELLVVFPRRLSRKVGIGGFHLNSDSRLRVAGYACQFR